MIPSALLFLLVGVAGGLGAVARYLLAQRVQRRFARAFPLGTLAVNATGCFALGLVSQLLLRGAVSGEVATVLGAGFCGGYTTYSTFAYETLRLAEERALWLTAANLLATSLLCAVGGLLGVGLGGLL